MKNLFLTLIFLVFSIPAFSQVKLMSLYDITPERAELKLDTPFDTITHGPFQKIYRYKNFDGIYEIMYIDDLSVRVELIFYEKWKKYRTSEFLDDKRYEINTYKTPRHHQETFYEKVGNNSKFTIVKKFSSKPSLFIEFYEEDGYVLKIILSKDVPERLKIEEYSKPMERRMLTKAN